MIRRPEYPENLRKWYGVDSGKSGEVKFGTNTHAFIQGEGSGDANSGAVLDLGAKINRDELVWQYVEQVAGVYRWTAESTGITEYMTMVDDLQTAGVVSLGVLGFNNPDNYDPMPASLDAFLEYVRHVVSNTAGKIDIYEVWNEWNTGFGTLDTSVEDYLTILRATYRACKESNANVVVLSPVALNPYHPANADWTQEFLASDWQDYTDGFSLHQYAGPTGNQMHAPERSYQLMQAFCQRIKSTAPSMPIYMTESGYYNGSATEAITEAAAKAYLSRYPFLLRSCPFDAVLLYEARNTGAGTAGTAGENYGLYTSSWVAKAQQVAVVDALVHVHDASSARYYNSSSSHAVLLEVTDNQRLALWALSNTTINVLISAAESGTLTIETIGGDSSTSALSSGNNIVAVSLTDTAVVLSADVEIEFTEFR